MGKTKLEELMLTEDEVRLILDNTCKIVARFDGRYQVFDDFDDAVETWADDAMRSGESREDIALVQLTRILLQEGVYLGLHEAGVVLYEGGKELEAEFGPLSLRVLGDIPPPDEKLTISRALLNRPELSVDIELWLKACIPALERAGTRVIRDGEWLHYEFEDGSEYYYHDHW